MIARYQANCDSSAATGVIINYSELESKGLTFTYQAAQTALSDTSAVLESFSNAVVAVNGSQSWSVSDQASLIDLFGFVGELETSLSSFSQSFEEISTQYVLYIDTIRFDATVFATVRIS